MTKKLILGPALFNVKFVFRQPFNIDKAREVSNLFVGDLNLSGFASSNTSIPKIRYPDGTKKRLELYADYFYRHIDEFSIVETPPPHQMMFEPLHELYNFYTVKVTARSFFTHQARLKRNCYSHGIRVIAQPWERSWGNRLNKNRTTEYF